MKFLQMCIIRYNLPCCSAHPVSCKKTITYNLARRIIVFVTNPEKIELKLSKLIT